MNDGSNIVLERIVGVDDTEKTVEYFWGNDLSGDEQGAGGVGGLLYLKRNGSMFVPIYDAYGNVMEYRAADGSLAASYVYDAFGRTVSQTGTLADVFRFRHATKSYERESALYYYGKRFYSPMLKRWLNRDPKGESGGCNLYASCKNGMTFSFDPIGTDRYITQFDILNYGGSGGTQLHVGVAVDRWTCANGAWVKTGVTTFDFGVDDSLGWQNTMWSIVGKAKGAIGERDGLHLKAPITLKSMPEQDMKMYDMIQKDISNPPFYNLLFHQCVFWSVGAINYGM